MFKIMLVIGIAVLIMVGVAKTNAVKMSDDPRIAERQKAAMNAQIFQKARTIRDNLKNLGWKLIDNTTHNGIKTGGWNGLYTIEFDGLKIAWKDHTHVYIHENGEIVYRAKMNTGILSDGNALGEVTTYLFGNWVSKLEQLYKLSLVTPTQAPPTDQDLEGKWGITG